MKSVNKINKPKSIRNIAASILLILLLAASLTGATYAWFVASSATIENVFTAGTVELSAPQIVSVNKVITPGSNIAFVPNAGEASVSIVNLTNFQAAAPISTIDQDSTPQYSPADYRVARMAIDRNGNAWVLNTMTGSSSSFDYSSAQGAVNRISENGDRAYFHIGLAGEGPRTIVMTDEGEGENIYFWVGFYLGNYFQKYYYNGNDLVIVAEAYIDLGSYTPYNAVLDDNGIMWVVSRHARPYPLINGTPGVIRFNTNDLTAGYETLVYNEPGNNPYSMMIDNFGDVWVSSGGPWGSDQGREFVVYDGDAEYDGDGSDVSYRNIPIGLAVPAMRGFLQSSDGTIWATTVDGRLIKGSYISGNWQFEEAASGLGELTGLGFDAQGILWVVSYGNNRLYGFDTTDIIAGYGNREIIVGSGPYAYDSFTRPGKTCKTVEWEFEVIGTKKVHVRVKPAAQLDGSSVTINLDENNNENNVNWQDGADGWWYYGSVSAPHEVQPNAGDNSKVSIVFKYCVPNDTDPAYTVSLIAEAVQSSHNAIDTVWSQHPWK